MVTARPDPMPVDLPDKVLETVRRHTCGTKGCNRDAVVFPPPACADHGGLEATL